MEPEDGIGPGPIFRLTDVYDTDAAESERPSEDGQMQREQAWRRGSGLLRAAKETRSAEAEAEAGADDAASGSLTATEEARSAEADAEDAASGTLTPSSQSQSTRAADSAAR